jgi:mono/diheme cytochrome c family protein
MEPLANAVLGLVFIALAVASTLLMYNLWGYPYDEERHISAAPRSLMLLHRALGYAYGAIYVFFMWQMLPRLWAYQVEFPPRTVAHFLLGMAIGVILLAKIAIVRFFKHLEGKMVPFLGTGLLICTVLLIGLSAPFAFREAYLARHMVFTAENLERLGQQLPVAGLPADAPLSELASERGLQQGRSLLQKKCVQCHDLRPVLARPQPPEVWVQTVQRMADRSEVTNPISNRDQWFIAAYLIAVSPDLQQSARKLRAQEETRQEAQKARQALAERLAGQPARALDPAAANALFKRKCSACHGLSNVADNPPNSELETRDLVKRMVNNGMLATEDELAALVNYLTTTYVKGPR